jgi:hypothetical protein
MTPDEVPQYTAREGAPSSHESDLEKAPESPTKGFDGKCFVDGDTLLFNRLDAAQTPRLRYVENIRHSIFHETELDY